MTTAAVALGLALVVAGGVLGAPQGGHAAAPDSVVLTEDALGDQISRTQQRLTQVPGDWTSWAGLALLYLERSRTTGDPTWYTKAQGAVERSFALHPAANTDASIAAGALANSRHDFAAGRRYARDAIAANAYSAEAYGVLGDAETQLGHRDAATAAIQRMLDLRPGLPAYSRAAYDLEQHGRTDEAQALLQRALADAAHPTDVAFCQVALGDLAWRTGRLAEAADLYASALRADQSNLAALLGRARVEAADGDVEAALADYATLTRRAPLPAYFLEYADLLQATGSATAQDKAQTQVRLATAAESLFVANGGIDGLTDVAVALATGDARSALTAAKKEWSRRQFADVADAMAQALYANGEPSQALHYADLAVDTGAPNAAYAYHRGLINLALGRTAQAREDLALALQTNPAFAPLDATAAHAALRWLGGTR
ncbi:MAG TPA: tetratricopeptide repeat protein [Micromonosporaceae bacterium]